MFVIDGFKSKRQVTPQILTGKKENEIYRNQMRKQKKK